MLNYLISFVEYDSFHLNRFQLNWTEKAMAAAEKCVECADVRTHKKRFPFVCHFHFNLS